MMEVVATVLSAAISLNGMPVKQDGANMIEHHSTSMPIVAPASHAAASIEFFDVQISPTGDGAFFISVQATICEGEADLSQMELGHHRAASLDDALGVIRQAVTTAH